MVLTLDEIESIRDDLLADDVDYDQDRLRHCDVEEVKAYFESGGDLSTLPTKWQIHRRKATIRWAVDISQWEPDDAELQTYYRLLPDHEAQKCTRFHFRDDQKRALVSRLLQRTACAHVSGLSFGDVEIGHTKGRKPYFANRPADDALPNWNYNVSHEGSFVVLAAEPCLLCGIDVAAPGQLRRGPDRSFGQLLETMRDSFTPREFATVRGAGSDRQMEDTFRKLWSLKEAFTKARGDGLGFKLGRCEFELTGRLADGVEGASVSVDSAKQAAFAFFIQPMHGNHWVSVARGPVSAAVDAHGGFRATFCEPDFADAAHLHRREPAFELRQVHELMPAAVPEA